MPHQSAQALTDNVTRQLEKLRGKLPAIGLADLQIFTDAYIVIARNIAAQISTGRFSDDDRLAQLNANFADYYFRAVEQFHQTGVGPAAWQPLFELCRRGTGKRLQLLALGVNAHVNNDLGLALHAAQVGDDFHQDYQQVRTITEESYDEIIAACAISWPRGNGMVRSIMADVMLSWRENAWDNYLSLAAGTATPAAIEHSTVAVGRRLLRLPWPI